jgi:hypothetical protein
MSPWYQFEATLPSFEAGGGHAGAFRSLPPPAGLAVGRRFPGAVGASELDVHDVVAFAVSVHIN